MINVPQLIHEPEKEYHARSKSGEVMSSHLLQLFCKSPFKYHATVSQHLEEEPNPAYAFGSATHKLILEGGAAFSMEYNVCNGPINPKTNSVYGKTTKAYMDWLSEQTKNVVTTEDFAEISMMKESCLANAPIAELLRKDGEAEGVIRTLVDGVMCQIRIDYLTDDEIVDLKTCRDLEFFEKDCRDFGYAYQLAFYRMVFREATGRQMPCSIIAVDKTDFHISGRWDFVPADLDECEQVLHAALRRYKRCKEEDTWETGFERARIFSLHKD